MTTVKQSVPLFLSSSRDVTGDTDETSFTVRLSPPLIISDQAKKVTAFIQAIENRSTGIYPYFYEYNLTV